MMVGSLGWPRCSFLRVESCRVKRLYQTRLFSSSNDSETSGGTTSKTTNQPKKDTETPVAKLYFDNVCFAAGDSHLKQHVFDSTPETLHKSLHSICIHTRSKTDGTSKGFATAVVTAKDSRVFIQRLHHTIFNQRQLKVRYDETDPRYKDQSIRANLERSARTVRILPIRVETITKQVLLDSLRHFGRILSAKVLVRHNKMLITSAKVEFSTQVAAQRCIDGLHGSLWQFETVVVVTERDFGNAAAETESKYQEMMTNDDSTAPHTEGTAMILLQQRLERIAASSTTNADN